MTFDEMFDNVVNLTNHPEMVGEITTAIQSSTLKMHQSDYYARDAVEQLIILTTDNYIAKIDIPGNLTRFRAVRWIRKWDPKGTDATTGATSGSAGPFMELVDPEAIIDGYGYIKPNRYYVAGDFINIRSAGAQRQYLLSYYQYPQVSPKEKYTSWIAATVPFAIIFDSTSLIFQMLAMQDQARKFDTFVMEQLHIVQMHGLNARGY